jgi:N-acyl-D-amino-acid deacylase
MHDLVIRGGFLVDGSGSPRGHADIAVSAGVITAVVDSAPDVPSDIGNAVEVIDGSGASDEAALGRPRFPRRDST